jgi:hypothetical protein
MEGLPQRAKSSIMLRSENRLADLEPEVYITSAWETNKENIKNFSQRV